MTSFLKVSFRARNRLRPEPLCPHKRVLVRLPTRRPTRPATWQRRPSHKPDLAGPLGGVLSHDGLLKPPKHPQNWWKNVKYEWIPMIDNGKYEQRDRIKDVSAVRRLDVKRKDMLTIARNLRPIDSVGAFSLLPRTVLPRIMKYGWTWLILVLYALIASLTRIGTDFGEVDVEKFDAGTSIITFMIVFYVGYCYTRYNQMFDDVERIMHSLTDACMLARVHFKDLNEVHRFWRYCNMLHAAAYTSLTVAYSKDNFFGPVCEKSDLFARDQVDRANEMALLEKVNLDGEDSRATAMIEVWLLEIIRDKCARARPDGRPYLRCAYRCTGWHLPLPFAPRGLAHQSLLMLRARAVLCSSARRLPSPCGAARSINGPIFKNLNDEVQKMGDSVKRLFSYQYQVLPFVYTHLVSTCCVFYLMLTAVVKGLQFEPDASITFGFILPFSSILTQMAAIFGLLEVGDTIMDPFGQDPEDFAVLHFVECSIGAPPRNADTGDARASWRAWAWRAGVACGRDVRVGSVRESGRPRA